MKISGPSGTSQASPSRAARPAAAGGGFSIASTAAPAAAAPSGSVASTGHMMGVEALIALQDVGSPLERKRRSVARAGRLLDLLDELKVALVGGDVTAADLANLARTMREERAATEDPRLEGVLDEIETRAAVELAKLEAASRAA